MRVYIKSINQNTANHAHLKPHVVYADLHAVADDRLLIRATLTYISQAIEDRGYILSRVDGGDVLQRIGFASYVSDKTSSDE